MKMKNFAKIAFLVLAMLIFSTAVFADNGVNVSNVKINGETYVDGESLRVELGDGLDIKVKLLATANVSDLEVSARLVGYDHTDREPLRTYDVKIVDRMTANDVEYVTLSLDVPKLTDKDYYTLRIAVDGRNVAFVQNMPLRINVVGADHNIDITRVSFDPTEVVAGRAVRARVKLENLGMSDENDVYIKVAIPALGASAASTADVDQLDSDETLTSEDLLLRIPACAKSGVYNVVTTVEYDDGYEVASKTSTVTVVGDETCSAGNPNTVVPVAAVSRTIITPPQAQDVTAGIGGASFPVVITNEGNTDKVYSVTVSGVTGWGSAQIANPAPMVKAGATEVVYVYVTANENTVAGKQIFDVKVSDGQDSRTLQVVANVAKAQSSVDLKTILYVGVIVLLVLVIILGLIIGFSKSKSDKEKEYY